MVSREQVLQLMEQDTSWPWYGQLMRRPQTICYLLQINTWLELYGVDMVF